MYCSKVDCIFQSNDPMLITTEKRLLELRDHSNIGPKKIPRLFL